MKSIFTSICLCCICATLLSQSPCDSLSILSLNYDAIHSDSINVIVKNESSIIFGYPSFTLLNEFNDTIAKETVAYFGIGNYPQGHIMRVEQPFNGNEIPNGKVILMGGFGDTAACVFNEEINLCSDSCSPMRVSVQAGTAVDSTKSVNIFINDSNNQEVYSTMFVLDTIYDIKDDTLCLPPGHYTYVIEEVLPSSNQVYYGLNPFYLTTGINANTTGISQTSHSFTIWEKCLSPDTVTPPFLISELNSTEVNTLIIENKTDEIVLRSSSNSIINYLLVVDMHGKILMDQTSNSSRVKLHRNEMNPGVYIAKVLIGNHWYANKIVI